MGTSAVLRSGRSTRRAAIAAALAMLTFVVVPGAPAGAAARDGYVDLLSEANMRIDGPAANAYAGYARTAGDVNGDGIGDILVGAWGADPTGRPDAGMAWVVFGRPAGADLWLGTLGTRGFRIDGAAAGDWLGEDIAAVGDVNDDGLDDIAVGAMRSDITGTDAGSAWVVFGKSTTTPVDLAALGAGGFRIDGASANDWAGAGVSAGGDVNRDGLDDILVGAPRADRPGRTDAGSVYLVYGRTATTTVALADLATGGYRIDGGATGDDTGAAVGAIADMNGDQRPEALVGAPTADGAGRPDAGAAYVVYGKGTTAPVDLASLGAQGMRIDGPSGGARAGYSIDASGDVNGDGRGDIAVVTGAIFAGRTGSSTTYVITAAGPAQTVDLADLGTRGFAIGTAAYEGTNMVTGADVNGDGLADVVLGSSYADALAGRADAGTAFVVYGRAATTPVDLTAPGAAGIRIDGAAAGDRLGISVSGGDVTGDGRPDVLAGGHGAGNNSYPSSGSVYVVEGFGPPPTPTPPGDQTPATPPAGPASPAPPPPVGGVIQRSTAPGPAAALLRVVDARLTLVRGAIAVRVTCAGAAGTRCTGTLTVATAKKVRFGGRRAVVTLGRARYSVAAGRSATVRVAVSATRRSLVRRLRKVKVAVSAGNATRRTVTLTAR